MGYIMDTLRHANNDRLRSAGDVITVRTSIWRLLGLLRRLNVTKTRNMEAAIMAAGDGGPFAPKKN